MNIRNIQPTDCPDDGKPIYWCDLTIREKAILTIYRLIKAFPGYQTMIIEMADDELETLGCGTENIIEMVEEGHEIIEVMAYIERTYGGVS